jgi:regulator of sirC expression with transglutaminase-like and TPR domain
MRALLKAQASEDVELSAAHYAPMANRTILIRLQNNIKQRLLAADEKARAIAVIERMLMIAPKDGGLWHEAALVHATLENLRAALVCFDAALGLAKDAAARQRIDAEIAALRGKLN